MTEPIDDLRFVTMPDVNTAVGVATRLMMSEAVFARLPFGEWAAVLDGQAQRGHYGFVLASDHQVLGFLGWGLTTSEKAEQWAAGAALSSDECREGECLIINAWVEKSPPVHRFLFRTLRSLAHGRAMIYARRAYPDGSVRLTRQAVDDIVGRLATPPTPIHSDPLTAADLTGAST